ncbi:MAG: chromate resistance protein ChrB domain-containing protein [Myxococcaceae bacterium]
MSFPEGGDRHMHGLMKLCVVLALVTSVLPHRVSDVQEALVTHEGMGPDKWATAWLLKRFVRPGAPLHVVSAGSALPEGLAFDVPSSPYRRIGGRTAFESARVAFADGNSRVEHFGRFIHDIEINFWGADELAASSAMEQGFRALRRQHGRRPIPADCYLRFFDHAYALLNEGRVEADLTEADFRVDCGGGDPNPPTSTAEVVELPVEQLLSELRSGKSVAFVDVREPDEFREAHLPRALNVPLRDLAPALIRQLMGVDYVVSYCVKDFRGYEMALALSRAGIQRSAILRPFGIKGWVRSGLPVTQEGFSDDDAARALARCAAVPEACLRSEGDRR